MEAVVFLSDGEIRESQKVKSVAILQMCFHRESF